MREGFELLRENRQSRAFFLTLAQSSLGTGAGYVALLLIAYERYESPWAISIVLGADLLPAMLLGPVFGAIADRWSRRWCAVAADVVRVVAFVGIALVDSFTATVAFALLAGVGTGLFLPSTVAGLASISGEKRLPAATALYGAASDFGYTLGPAIAAGGLALLGSETLLVANGATFAVSAVVLWKLSWGQTEPAADPSPLRLVHSILRDALDGVQLAARLRGTRTVLFAGGALLFFGGLLNVAELILAYEELDAGETGFAMLVAVFGFGFIGGSLSGSKGGELSFLKRRFLLGAAVWGVGMIAAGVAPTLLPALIAFAVIGFGNGAVLVYERQIIQHTVAGSSLGRVFGLRDSLTAWAFAFAFLLAGILITALGPRTLLVAAGIGDLIICGFAALALRRVWLTDDQPPGETPRPETSPALGADARPGAAGQLLGAQHLPDLVNGQAAWLTLLDDMGNRADHRRIELGTGVHR